jgi:hypothetical protein
MDHCTWTIREIEDILCLVCDFSGSNCAVSHMMEILYGAAAELAQKLATSDLQCALGVGPLEGDLTEVVWQIAIIPLEDEAETDDALDQLLTHFHQHLISEPSHHKTSSFAKVSHELDPTLN